MSSIPIWLALYATLFGLMAMVGVNILGAWLAYCYVHQPRTEYVEVDRR